MGTGPCVQMPARVVTGESQNLGVPLGCRLITTSSTSLHGAALHSPLRNAGTVGTGKEQGVCVQAHPIASCFPYAALRQLHGHKGWFVKMGMLFFPSSGCWYQAPQIHEEWGNADVLRSLQAAGTHPYLATKTSVETGLSTLPGWGQLPEMYPKGFDGQRERLDPAFQKHWEVGHWGPLGRVNQLGNAWRALRRAQARVKLV